MFQTGTPVTGEGFEDREAELAALGRAMERLVEGSPQWMAILGPRKIGKTSLVLEAVRRMPDGALRAMAMDAQEWGSHYVKMTDGVLYSGGSSGEHPENGRRRSIATR